MLRQIKLLVRLELHGFLDINKTRYTNNKKEKRKTIGLLCTFILIGIMICSYSCGIAYMLTSSGNSRIVPYYISFCISAFVLMFTVIRGGDTVFNIKSYETLIVLPIKPQTIVTSRFVTMYILNLLISAIISLPCIIVSAGTFPHKLSYVFIMLTGTLLLPVIPMCIALVIRVIINAAAAKLKHKNAVTIVLSITAVIACIILPNALFGYKDIESADFSNMFARLLEKASAIMPHTILFIKSANGNNLLLLLLFYALSIGIVPAIIIPVGIKYRAICSAMAAVNKNGVYIKSLQKESPIIIALLKRNLKRYFSSSIYVTNTMMGYVIACVVSVGAAVYGFDKIGQILGGSELPVLAMPLLLSAMYSMMPPTSCCISMEGRQWWLMRSLPVSAKTLFDSMLLTNFAVAAPFYLISSAALLISIKPKFVTALLIVALPLLYILFSSLLSLKININNPSFDWESETQPVKQSKSALICMLLGIVCVAIPAAVLMILPKGLSNIFLTALALLLTGSSYGLYKSIGKTELRKIN